MANIIEIIIALRDQIAQPLKKAGEEVKGFTDKVKQSNAPVQAATVSVKQYQQAMRQLPAQITDIVTSLASGQKPWLVAIQQGGQLKDSFGGVGSALRALSSVITPARIAIGGLAGTVITLVTAYAQGQRESFEFNKAIILTGNAAGVTSGQLGVMADKISDIVGSQHEAAGVLTQVLGAGSRISGPLVQDVAQLAIELKKVADIPVKETITQFAALGEAPVQAAEQLQKQFNFLTVATYQQIVALQKNGDTAKAAEVAQRAFLDAQEDRVKQLQERAGTLQKMWSGIKETASEAWSGILAVGRDRTPEERLRELQKQRGDRPLGKSVTLNQLADDAEEQRLQKFVEANKRIADSQAAAAKATNDYIKSLDAAPIQEARTTQRKAELEGLTKLLDQFEQDTKLTEDKIYQDYLETTTKIKELQKAGIIDAEEAAKRISNARIKYESDVLIDPVKITQSKVVVQQVLTQQQQAVNKFVDTLSVGLDNLAHSGELTGRSILKYLLSAFEAQVLKDAIAGLGSYLKGALGGTGGAGSSAFGSFLSGIFGAFGHAAGGGRMSGPRIVGEDGPELDMGGGNIMNRRQMAFAMAGGGGVSITNNNVFNVSGTDSPAQIVQYMEARLAATSRRNAEQLDRKLKENWGRGLR